MIKTVISYVLFALAGIQTLLGILWVLLNINNIQMFAENIGFVGNIHLTVVIQIFLLIFSSFYFWKSFVDGWKTIAVSLFFPMQPFLLQTSFTAGKMALVLPAMLMIIGFLLQRKDNQKGIYNGCIFVIGIALIISAFNIYPGAQQKSVNSPSFYLMSRTVEGHLGEYYTVWPESVKNVILEDEAITISASNEYLKEEFAKKLEEAYGVRQSKKVYRELAWKAFSINSKEVLNSWGRDFTSYLFLPYSVFMQSSRQDHGMTGWNYSRFTKYEPQISQILWKLSGACFLMLTVYTILQLIANRKTWKTWAIWKISKKIWISGLAAWLGLSFVFSVMTPNLVDYKLGSLIIALWYVMFMSYYIRMERADDNNKTKINS